MKESYQQILYKLAMKAYKKGDIPVAAILVKDNKIEKSSGGIIYTDLAATMVSLSSFIQRNHFVGK